MSNGTASGEEIFAVATPTAATGAAAAPDRYGAVLVPPAADGTPFKLYGTVSQGDLVKVTVSFLANKALSISPGDSVQIKIMPAHGSSTTVAFTVAPVLSAGTINLR
jgi:archaellin